MKRELSFSMRLLTVDSYIAKPSAETVILNDKPFVFQPEKTDLTKSLNGVFAFAGAEKWVFADHLLNVPMATIATTPAEAKNIEKEKIDAAKPAFKAYAEALKFMTEHAAGLKGHASRGPELINAANYGYDQTVQPDLCSSQPVLNQITTVLKLHLRS